MSKLNREEVLFMCLGIDERDTFLDRVVRIEPAAVLDKSSVSWVDF
jgi:hypothetical protein